MSQKPPPRQPRYVQVFNPLTGRYVKLSTRTGRIVALKKSPGPYKGVPVR